MPMTASKTDAPPVMPESDPLDTREAPELVIRPRRGWIGIDWNELIHYRELLFFLVWRDVKVRYKQAILGVAWAVLQPVFAMLVYTMFGKIGGFESKLTTDVPIHVWIYAGLLPWMFFATAIGMGGMSLVSQQHLLTKIYFPRLFIPTATIGGALFDMCVSAGVFAILMLTNGIVPSWEVVFIPLLLILQLMAGLGAAYTLAALTVSYRDFRFIIPFMVQLLIFVSFVFIPLESISPRLQWLASLNPFTGIIDAYRAAIFSDHPWRLTNLLISGLTASSMFVFGLFYFRKTERRFADIA